MLEEIFTAKTLDDAKSLAVKKFGVAENEISFEILEEAKKGLFGRIKGDYKVKATYNPPVVEEPIPQPVENIVEVVENVEETQSSVEEVVSSEEIQEESAPIDIPTQDVQVKEEVITEEPVEIQETQDTIQPVEIVETEEVSKDTEEVLPTPEELLEKSKMAQAYVTRILEKMGINTESEIIQNENGVVIDFKGDGTGTIIGKRGETLDALQYLSAMICNKGENSYYRITLDSCGYRAKRKVILKELAQKVSKNVLRTGRSQALEPMNPYERRIIHATISEIDGVTSRSVGEEPFRKVIISSTNPKKHNNNRKGYHSNSNGKRGGRGNNNKYRGNGRKKTYQPRSLDLKTSFEKDYKKPKPEDNLNAGLYGKIEF